MKVICYAHDNGDGSCSVQFYRTEDADLLTRLENEQPEYNRGEGGTTIEVADGFDLSNAGVFRTREDILEELDSE